MIGQAVVLVGGLGTRLGPLTRQTPKPALAVGGRPFLLWLLDELRRFGVRDVLLLAGVHGEQILDLARGRSGVRVLIEPEPLGTGGALRFASDFLAERFYFLNGDSLFDVNLLDLAALASDGLGALALRAVRDGARYGQVMVDGDAVTAFRDRPLAPGPSIINGGVAVLRREVLSWIAPDGPVSIERDVYPGLAAAGRLRGRVYDRPFLDIGIPEDFARAQSEIPRMMRRDAILAPWDRVLASAVGNAPLWRPGAVAGVKAANDAGLLVGVVAPQAGAAGHGRGLRQRLNSTLTMSGAHLDVVMGDLDAEAPALDALPQWPAPIRRIFRLALGEPERAWDGGLEEIRRLIALSAAPGR